MSSPRGWTRVSPRCCGREIVDRDGRTQFLSRIPNHEAGNAALSVLQRLRNLDLRWLVRKKIDRLPGNADERARAIFKKAQSYMVLMDDKVDCKNMRCRKRFDISGIRTTAFLTEV